MVVRIIFTALFVILIVIPAWSALLAIPDIAKAVRELAAEVKELREEVKRYG